MIYNKQGTFFTKDEFSDKLKQAYSLKNLQKIVNKNMKLWGWQKMPDFIKHYKEVGDLVKVPAGIRGYWKQNFDNEYGQVRHVTHPPLLNPFGNDEDKELTKVQDDLIHKLLEQDVALAHASTGVGKTSCIAKIIDKLQVRTLIVCQGLTLMKQMQNDLNEFFGVKCFLVYGSMGKQKTAYRDIVIVNIDSVGKIDPSEFDLTLYDEADKYLSSDTRREFLFNNPCKYQYSLTGTIKVNNIPDDIFRIYFGPKKELILKHFSPTIYKVYTDFYTSTFQVNEFYKLKEALYYNEERNKLIIDTIVDTIGDRKGIVFGEYIEHSKLLSEALEKRGIKTFVLIGEVKNDERERIKKELKEWKGRCVLIGSVQIIGRGFNIPELSVGYLTTCEKFKSNIEQYVGRIIRQFPGKEGCDWYDFVDAEFGPLLNQAKQRTSTYKKEFPESTIKFI